ncbi:MAG: SpoIIE family protein phosphatase [Actinomycetes bacterium]
MTGDLQPGPCCLLVDTTPEERALLEPQADLRTCTRDDLEAACAEGVDVVVIGSEVEAPVSLVQRAHRAAPDAGIVVLTRADTAEQVRRVISFAPGVPLDVVLADAAGPVREEVARVGAAAAQQRRHRELLAAVSSRTRPAPQARPRLLELGALLEHAPLGVLVSDAHGTVVGWNRRAAELVDVSLDRGAVLEELLPGAGVLVERVGGPAADGAGAASTTLSLTTARGVDVDVSAVTSQLDDGHPAVLLLVVDVTQRRAAERARDRLAGHVALLGRVSASLTSTLDTEQSLQNLVSALVPDLADWASIELFDAGGGVGRVVMRHRDPALDAVVAQAQARAVVSSAEASGRRKAGGGGPLLLQQVDDGALEAHVPDTALRSLVRQLGVASVITVPLPGRDAVLGSLALVNAPGSPPLSDAELAVAVEVGRRAGVALDNARLYAQQRDLATELQRSLLTDPPQPDHGQILVRYVAAAQEAQVGGDWYDAFLQPDGATVLVIGDVVGHDTAAAAGMSQLRGVLRGIAFTTGSDPADVLSRLDCAIEGLLIGTTATAIVARLEQEPADVEAGRTWVRWSNAGHPPPIVIDPLGRASVLDDTAAGAPEQEADLLLGLDPTTSRRNRVVPLREGSTLLLYTDGLVERRGQSLDEGVAALLEVMDDCAGLSLDDLCDAALDRLLPQEPEDDVALVAVRLHRQSRPRPVEAGPNRVPRTLADPAD